MVADLNSISKRWRRRKLLRDNFLMSGAEAFGATHFIYFPALITQAVYTNIAWGGKEMRELVISAVWRCNNTYRLAARSLSWNMWCWELLELSQRTLTASLALTTHGATKRIIFSVTFADPGRRSGSSRLDIAFEAGMPPRWKLMILLAAAPEIERQGSENHCAPLPIRSVILFLLWYPSTLICELYRDHIYRIMRGMSLVERRKVSALKNQNGDMAAHSSIDSTSSDAKPNGGDLHSW